MSITQFVDFERQCQLFCRKRTATYDAIADGRLTKPFPLGPGKKGWPEYELAAIQAAQIAGKTEDEIRELVKTLQEKRQELLARNPLIAPILARGQ